MGGASMCFHKKVPTRISMQHKEPGYKTMHSTKTNRITSDQSWSKCQRSPGILELPQTQFHTVPAVEREK